MAGAVRGVVEDRLRRRERYRRRRLRSSIPNPISTSTSNPNTQINGKSSHSPRTSLSPELSPSSPTTAAVQAGLSPQAPLIYEERTGWTRKSETESNQNGSSSHLHLNGVSSHQNGASTSNHDHSNLVNGFGMTTHHESKSKSMEDRYDVDTDPDLKRALNPPISREELDSHMMFADSPPLDILVRTSGVRRLSDFMLWQVSKVCEEQGKSSKEISVQIARAADDDFSSDLLVSFPSSRRTV